MRVLYDSQKFDEQRVGGASRYWHELIRSLADIPGFEPVVALRHTANLYARSIAGRTRFWQSWHNNRRLSIQLLKRGDFDVFHPTYYNPYFLESIGGKPYVVTVLDMIHERLPQFFSPAERTRAWKSQVVGQAAAVVAISEHTKRDLLELLDVGPEKVWVVPLASSIADVAAEIIPDAPARFVLYVGQRGKYKNFMRLVQALAGLLQGDRELKLVCAGGSAWQPHELAIFSAHGIAQQVWQKNVTEGQLAYLYRQALVLVYPSLHEGFGLPVLEAISCGCPVAASCIGALLEVGGEAADYFIPTDASDMHRVVAAIVESPSVRERLRMGGPRRAQQFSWDKVARQTAAVYEQAA